MTPWSEDETKAIAERDDLHISPFRDDGDLYVRPYNGHASRWYQAAMRQRGGRISVAGMSRDVSFEPVGDQVNEQSTLLTVRNTAPALI